MCIYSIHSDSTPPKSLKAHTHRCVEFLGLIWVAPLDFEHKDIKGLKSYLRDSMDSQPIRSMIIHCSAENIFNRLASIPFPPSRIMSRRLRSISNMRLIQKLNQFFCGKMMRIGRWLLTNSEKFNQVSLNSTANLKGLPTFYCSHYKRSILKKRLFIFFLLLKTGLLIQSLSNWPMHNGPRNFAINWNRYFEDVPVSFITMISSLDFRKFQNP